MAGPREEDLAQLGTMLVARRGTPVNVQVVRNPADPDAGMQATGGLLPGPGARLAGPTFEEWLGQQQRERVVALRVRPIAAGRALPGGAQTPARHYGARRQCQEGLKRPIILPGVSAEAACALLHKALPRKRPATIASNISRRRPLMADRNGSPSSAPG